MFYQLLILLRNCSKIFVNGFFPSKDKWGRKNEVHVIIKIGGETAVYISHRMSSCRFCENIVVFEDGNIVQAGSHYLGH